MEELEPALELSGQPVKRGTMAHQHIVYMMLADSASQSGDITAMRKYAQQLEELAQRDDHQPYQAIAHRTWGVIHRAEEDFDSAKSRLNLAREIFEEVGAPWQLGRTLRELAELAMAQEDLSHAGDYYQEALTVFESLQAQPDIDRTIASLSAVQ